MSYSTKLKRNSEAGAKLTSAIRGLGSAKELARIIGCTEATAKNYRQGLTFPDVFSLAKLMGKSQAVTAAFLDIAGLTPLSDQILEARLRKELAALQELRAMRTTLRNASKESDRHAAVGPATDAPSMPPMLARCG
jgi:hypothetical protein